jgi:hypothetical protein
MSQYDASRNETLLFSVMRQYMNMVMAMIMFIQAVRTGDWELHIVALETFSKYFFARNRLVYALMIPVYLADRRSIKQIDPEIYQEFVQGN